LKGADYRTVLLGKYLNDYPSDLSRSYVPPGWDEWYGRLDPHEYDYYDYYVNENGRVVHYGNDEKDYYTDVLARKAKGYVRRTAPGDEPFFMYLSVGAPHGPATPAKRHKRMFTEEKLPRPPSFNEADVSDKPTYVRKAPLLTADQIKENAQRHRDRLKMLQAVDEMIEGLVNELRAQGELKNTYLIFTSDNGWHQGEHPISRKKRTPYEESIRVPLVVRGPGVPAGQTREEFALNIDMAPTFAGIGKAAAPDFVDGRTLEPLLTGDTPSTWHTAFLLENSYDAGQPVVDPGTAGSYYGVRTDQQKYVDMYNDGERELYDLTADLYELTNGYPTADPALIASLQTRLDALKACAGQSCRDAEDGQ
jgi:arylsulfatase A-like enzyme